MSKHYRLVDKAYGDILYVTEAAGKAHAVAVARDQGYSVGAAEIDRVDISTINRATVIGRTVLAAYDLDY